MRGCYISSNHNIPSFKWNIHLLRFIIFAAKNTDASVTYKPKRAVSQPTGFNQLVDKYFSSNPH